MKMTRRVGRAQERKDFPNYVLRLRTKSCNFSESTTYSHLLWRTMRRLFAALVLSLALSAAAHADSFQYTIVWDLPHVANADTSEFIGTYTFTVGSFLDGNTFVYGPGFSGPQFSGSYLYAADFTVPANSDVSQIEISYFPDYSQYGFGLYQSNGGAAVTTSLLQDPNDPNMFFADYGDGSFSSMQITEQRLLPFPSHRPLHSSASARWSSAQASTGE
jgi:hypothetical protein